MQSHPQALSVWIVVAAAIWCASPAVSMLSAEEPVKYVDPRDSEGSSAAVVVPDAGLLLTAQFLPLDAQGELIGKGRANEQIAAVLKQLDEALDKINPEPRIPRPIVKLNVVVANDAVASEVRKALADKFGNNAKPAVSYVAGKLRHPEALVAVDAVAIAHPLRAGAEPLFFSKGPSESERNSFAAILPPGPKFYISGQAEKGNDLAEMTRRTLESLKATLEHLGLELKHVRQVKSFVGPMTDVADAEREIMDFFLRSNLKAVPPLLIVEWTTSPSIEIELIASRGRIDREADNTIEFITPPGMTASPVFSRVARMPAGPMIYFSGLYGTSTRNGESETLEIFERLGKLLDETGSDFRHLIKATYYVSTDEASAKLNALRPRFYDPQRPPAASKAPVTATGIEGKTITLDMIAIPRR